MTHNLLGAILLKAVFPILLSFTAIALVACGQDVPFMSDEQRLTENQTLTMSPSSISKARLMRIETVLQEEVDAGIRAGFVAMVAKDGEVVYQTAVGMADRENGVPMAEDTRFHIMSMTKAITTIAIMQLVEKGYILLNDPVSRYIPAFADMQVATSHSRKADGTFETEPLARPLTIHHLLTHTAGFGSPVITTTELEKHNEQKSPFLLAEGSLSARIDLLAALPLFEQPGEKFRYGYGLDVAGRIVEIVSGQSLEDYFQDKLFKPLGMKDTGFFFDESDLDRLAVVYDVNQDGKLIPLQLGPKAKGLGWMPGGAGLVSTADDYMRFYLMLLNKGEWEGKRVLSPASIRLMFQRSLPRSAGYQAVGSINEAYGATFGLGGDVLEHSGQRSEMGAVGEWGWFGYLNTDAFLNPGNELAVIVMSQQVPEGAPTSRAINLVKAIAYGAVEN